MADGMNYKGKKVPTKIQMKRMFIENWIKCTTEHTKIEVRWGDGKPGSNTRRRKTRAERDAQQMRRHANHLMRAERNQAKR